ncbi:2-oxoglutarate dehydrogenase E1 component [Nitrosococcus watsonii]|uniref:2-oxoglutarate dehydrogenase E1 component n=1 Tax=Nitrosococcus watsoni (strain C-113) TaxID=105559 RepID=D8K880_NITWC|nr:2-oxoglutarate dehydrogenase E1 component [Nitrosococcus watsonii]ADJ27075.1 2-oxoglutarate dehydrogenase, E1 subunit [Nitrosococcus watsonii C-113]
MDATVKKRASPSPLNAANASYLEALYEKFLKDPNTVPAHWRIWFKRLQAGVPEQAAAELPARSLGPAVQPLAAKGRLTAEAAEKQIAVLQLINAYRFRGHQKANIDPLRIYERPVVPDLDPAFHGLTEEDMGKVFNTGSLIGIDRAPLQEIFALINKIYCQTIGAEYMHITETAEKRWIQNYLEGAQDDPGPSAELQRHILERLTAAEGLERYLHTNYVGQKRFSLEGGDSLIPLLDNLILHAGSKGVGEIVIGMAHRGRLNVLVNTLGKLPRDLFMEFEGRHETDNERSGDVKYHLGFSADGDTPGGPVHITLAFNPSHLEIIDPVVEGSVRARQQRRKDWLGDEVIPVLIHGDSAFAGQGVVMETFNMSQSRGFFTGGTLHIVINNQVGFTTSNPLDTRSTVYCTDVAKMVQAPIFHVNGDDPEAVLFTARLALDYRTTFKKDVVIDLVCYRRQGHNEADEPAVTQPLMYQKIRSHPTVRHLYAEHLTAQNIIAPEEPERMMDNYRQTLEQGTNVAPYAAEGARSSGVNWKPFLGTQWDQPVETEVPLPQIQELAALIQQLPKGFELHSRVGHILADRRKMAAGALPIDWGFAETLAYATLLNEGFSVRLTGQDSGRGTFFHRHAVLYNQKDGQAYVPLEQVNPAQTDFSIIDSLLSEEAVLAFEYGYAATEPNTLVIWEAQFGDFANGAQVVIDQFLAAGEAKWSRLCGLVLFLPHGYEGQGPEHSSARLERFLQLCAEDNIQVCVPTTPGQMFHMLRRQMLRPYRKPLIVMTPKSLLRHRLSVSSLDELSSGAFQLVMGEVDEIKPAMVKRVLLCAGKVYYDLLQARRKQKRQDVAILRLEQLYPFPQQQLKEELERYRKAKEVVWCQEEPRNQGAWERLHYPLQGCLSRNQTLHYAGRASSAAPAVGYFNLHLEQQRALVEEALGPVEESQ